MDQSSSSKDSNELIEKMNSITSELEETKQKCCALEKKLKDSVKEIESDTKDNQYVNVDEVIKLKEENNLLQETIKHYKDELDELREVQKRRRNDLMEQNLLIDELNDEIIGLKNQLEMYKNKPLEESREVVENSSYVKLNDRLSELQGTIDNMRLNFKKMKLEKLQNETIIIQLKQKNLEMLELWKIDISEIVVNKQMVSESYEDSIRSLGEIINEQMKLIDQLEKSDTGCWDPEYEFYKEMLKTKDEQIKKLIDDLEKKSFNFGLITSSLAEAKQEIKELNIKQLKQQAEIEKLENERKKLIDNDQNIIIDDQFDQLNIKTPIMNTNRENLGGCLKKTEIVESSKLSDSNVVKNRPTKPLKNELNFNDENSGSNSSILFQLGDISTTVGIDNKENNENKSNPKTQELSTIKKEVTFNEESSLSLAAANSNTSINRKPGGKVFITNKRNH